MQKEHEWFRSLSSRHAVKLYAIGGDILMSTEGRIGQTGRGDFSLRALKRLDWVLQDLPRQPQHRDTAPEKGKEPHEQLENETIHLCTQEIYSLQRGSSLSRFFNQRFTLFDAHQQQKWWKRTDHYDLSKLPYSV